MRDGVAAGGHAQAVGGVEIAQFLDAPNDRQQLGGGALVVRERVGLVAVLVHHHPVRVLGGDLLGDPDARFTR